MARCATIEPAQSEAAIIALGSNNSACEGRLYPTTDLSKTYVGMADGSLLGPLPGAGGDSSVPVAWETSTLTITNEVEVVVTYQGVAPALAKIADGVYGITVAVGTVVKGFFATSLLNATFTSVNSIRLRLIDGDEKRLYANYTVLQQATGEEAEELIGVIKRQTLPTNATVQAEFPNMSNLSGGYVIIGLISI